MKQELNAFTNSSNQELEILEVALNDETKPMVSGRGQCLVPGCTCKQMTSQFICGTCGHDETQHQDIDFH